MKTKKVAGGFDLPASAFALVSDETDSSTWKLPLFIPGNAGLTRNMIKNALERFADCKIPDEQRAEVWRVISGAAKAHGISAGAQPASALPVNAHPKPEQPLEADEAGLKQARAVGLLAADKLLKRLGY